MEIKRIFDLLEYSKEKYLYKDDIIAGKENGEWIKYSVNEYIEESNLFSLGILALGLEKGDRIVSISNNNRPEWNFIDMGACQAGVIHVPVYPTISKDDYFYILNHCKPKILIISDKQLYDKIEPIASMAGIKEIYSINSLNGVKNWRLIQQKGSENKHLLPELEKIKASIKSSDLFTIIYTSGTTGFPKGVMLSHSNIISNFVETAKAHVSGEESCVLSFLPLSHVYERCLNYHYQYKGMGIYYAENLGTIAENSKEAKPVLFCAVPRVIELFFEKILGKGHELPYLSRIIFFWAVRLAEEFDIDKPNRFFYNIKLKIADKLVFSKWREALGGKLDKIVSGGASLQIRLIKIFWAAKIQVIEGYGLTETSPVIAVNNLVVPLVKFGTVGPVLPGVQVKIADDGEILCRGHNVMMGYYKDEELTKEVIDKDGWFHTGDIGMFVDGKFLKITDRKKEIFKLSNGKYVAPQVIENKLKESEFIEQAIVLGEHQKYASALIIPNFPYLHTWSACYKISFSDNYDLIQDKRIIEHYNKVIADINVTLGSHEQIKRFKLLTDEWSAATGELSPTLKLKRNFIREKYRDVIEQIYPQK